MASIHPFPAILYRPDDGIDVTPFIAPPYDVIDPAQQAELKGRSSFNIVRLTLPEADSGGDPYREAAKLFRQWTEAGRLQRQKVPSLYVWEQEFEFDGQHHTRRALVAKVSCGPYQAGGVMRHEFTHQGPKADRLRLYQNTGAQFSQMFGIFRDDDGVVAAELAAASQTDPVQTARGDDGHSSRLFRIDDPERMARLQAELADRTITIADGHHRYETTVAYFQNLGRTGAALMTLVPSSDPGLLVLPTHRTVSLALNGRSLEADLAQTYAVERFPLDDWPRLYGEAISEPHRGMMVAVSPSVDQAFTIRWQPGADGEGALLGDVGVLHNGILPLIASASQTSIPDHFGYLHQAVDAVRRAGERDEWAFLLRPTSVATLLQVADREAVMPQKSTYFYPKFLAGFISAELG